MNDWSCSSKNAFYMFLERNVILEVWRELCVPVCCGSPMSFVSESKYSVSLGSQVTQMGWCRSWASWTIWIHGQLPMLKDSVTFQNPCLIFIHGYVSHVCFKVSGKQLGMEGIHWDLVRVLRCCDLLRDVPHPSCWQRICARSGHEDFIGFSPSQSGAALRWKSKFELLWKVMTSTLDFPGHCSHLFSC